MQSLFFPAICIIAISIVVIVIVRIRLKNKSKELSQRIATIIPYKEKQRERDKDLKQNDESFFIDIETDLKNSFTHLYTLMYQIKQSFSIPIYYS